MSFRGVRALSVVATLPLLLLAADAAARTPVAEPEEKPAVVECTDHCYILEQLVLRGDAKRGTIRFTLTGQVLAKEPQIIPLFGAPQSIGLSAVQLNGQKATIGFEDDAWYVRTNAKSFTLTGILSLGEETSLLVKGPVNAVDASTVGGYVSEGNHFNAASELSLTFEKGEKPKDDEVAPPAPSVVPTTYEIWRYIDAKEKTAFEYKLQIRGPAALEPLRIPLGNGENVTEVKGAKHTIEGNTLVISATGPLANVSVHGTLKEHVTFDATGHAETVVIHADAEHEVKTDGNALPLDAARTPFGEHATASTRAFHVRPGEKLSLQAKRRSAQDFLAGAVDHHARYAVWTSAGELVTLDTFSYDNSALDSLRLHTKARPIFLATDGAALPITREDGGGPLTIAMRTGRHDVKLQSLDQEKVRWLGGRLAMTMPTHGLTESTTTVSLGLPSGVHPVMITGGDERERFFGSMRDLLGLGLALGVSFLVFARARSRVLGTIAGFGAFTVAPALFAGASVLGLGIMLARSNYVRIPHKQLKYVGLGGGVFLSLVLAGVAAKVAAKPEATGVDAGWALSAMTPSKSPSVTSHDAARPWAGLGYTSNILNDHGVMKANNVAPAATPAALVPVELAMPQAARTVMVKRSLVTRDRPFTPTVYYVTDGFFWGLGAMWLLSLGGLAWLHRASLVRARTKLRELMTPPVMAPIHVHNTPIPPHPPYRTIYGTNEGAPPAGRG